MLECVLISVGNYQSIMYYLKKARIECDTAKSLKFAKTGVSNYYLEEIDRQIELAENLLKERGLCEPTP